MRTSRVGRCAVLCGAASILPWACAPGSGDADARAGELVLRSLFEARVSADTSLIAELFWPQATYDDYPSQMTYQGVGEIIGYLVAFHDWGDDVYMNIGRMHASDSVAVAEWLFSAVQSRPMGEDLPVATGREVVLNGVTIVELQGGRIIRAADYTDTAPMLLQLGGRIELPGGVVLELDSVGG